MDAALMQNFSKGFGTPYIICPYSCKYLHRGPDSKVIEYNRYEDIPEGIRNFYIITIIIEYIRIAYISIFKYFKYNPFITLIIYITVSA